MTFEITATSGTSSETFKFDLNLVNPCLVTTFDIDSSIVENEIDYNVHKLNSALVVPFDISLLTVAPASALCPDVELNLFTIDDTELDSSIFSYNQTP